MPSTARLAASEIVDPSADRAILAQRGPMPLRTLRMATDNVITLHHHRVALHRGAVRQSPELEAEAESIDADGVHLSDVGQVDLGRYVWMDLNVDEGEPVRALGEVQPRDPLTLALDIKFKHLFPDQKRRLMRALGK